IPHIGQFPGPGRTISGCIGQVHSVLVTGAAGDSGSSAIPHFGQGPGRDCRTSAHIGHTYVRASFSGTAGPTLSAVRALAGTSKETNPDPIAFGGADRIEMGSA